ncbi:hypothetical protein FOA52_003156 [Chlamydomonas sp. UWO 241]|nr:hypothetical protein FOA52_003156 [Chlamydomonas sp. UWO 241]
MEHAEFTVSDGTQIFYRRSAGAPGTPLPTLVLIHGWGNSGRYFDSCIEHLLSAGVPLLVPDQRFHGRSGKPAHGLHVARLAADVHELMIGLGVSGAVLVGTSMGCAVIWCLHELFGLRASGLAAGCVFVDQAPMQNKVEGWDLGGKHCYDAASLAALQAKLKRSVAEFAAVNVAGCLSKPIPAATRELLMAEMILCDGGQLGTLMADHTQLDHRATLPTIDVPCLCLVGGGSGRFPVEGSREVARLVPACREDVWEGCNHWLYIEEPRRFADALQGFARTL